MPLAPISLTLSRHLSLSFILSGRSSGLHPVFSHSCCMYVRAGRPAFARPYVVHHRCTSLMSSSLPLQQCPACLVRLTWLVFLMFGRWPYSWCFLGCCFLGCIFLVAFLCNCRLAFSPVILLASKLCMYIAVSIWALLGRNCVSFFWSGLTLQSRYLKWEWGLFNYGPMSPMLQPQYVLSFFVCHYQRYGCDHTIDYDIFYAINE